MNKKIILPLVISGVFLFIIILTIFIVLKNNWNKQIDNFEQNYDLNSGDLLINNKELSKEEIDSKIGTLKKKLSIKWLIAKGYQYFKQEEYTIALTKFLQILKEVPEDENTINKIWDVYYELKKFDKAYNYYLQIKDYKKLSTENAINSLIYSYINNLTKEKINFINKEIDKYNLKEEEKFYYKNSLSCVENFSLCKLNFQDFFKEQKSWTWSMEWTWSIEEFEYKNLLNIEKAIINYENFKLDDISYKNALISWTFFSNWLYPIAIETSKQILSEKPNYKPIFKIIAKSYYELWEYTQAKNFLTQYNELDNHDAEISYFLWVIYQKLHDYVLSSIHLKKALELWYPNWIEARRRIIFNYSEVWETKKMLKSFEDLIENEKENLNIEDFNLAIYFHIINKKYEVAKIISKYWIDVFEDNAIFYWYLWWIELEENWTIEWSLKLAEKNLNKAFELDNHDSMINYLLWLVAVEKKDLENAKIYFKTSINLDEKWEFWIRSKSILETINNKEQWL